MKYTLPIALLALVSMAVSAQADCFGARRLRLAEDQFVDMDMTVKAGKHCSLGLGSTAMMVERSEVTNRPRHGVVEFRETKMRYTAAGGYAGADAFSFAWKGKNRFGKDTLMGVNMKVTIEP